MAVLGYGKILLAISLQFWLIVCFAQATNVGGLRYATTDNLLRMSFDVSSSPSHRVYVLDNPPRLVIDIYNARLSRSVNQPLPSHPLFVKVRAASQKKSDLRVVVDLKKTVSAKNYLLRSDNSDKKRLVVDLINKGPTLVAFKGRKQEADNKPIVSVKDSKTKTIPETTKHAKAIADRNDADIRIGQFVVAVDAGHGGDDPGARGPKGTLEKKITFSIAKKLTALINSQPGMKAVMVRKGDYFVGLRNRMHIARAAKADLFISIHADAYQNAAVKGASVYTLSRNGASSEAARWLADSENAADLVGGVSLDDKEDVLKSVLLDLSQSATQEASVNVAGHVLKSFENICELHKSSVQKAGFLVLKSPDIPSILVETAFISNPQEERNLLSSAYQTKIANAIFKGVRNYFKQAVPVDSRIAAL